MTAEKKRPMETIDNRRYDRSTALNEAETMESSRKEILVPFSFSRYCETSWRVLKSCMCVCLQPRPAGTCYISACSRVKKKTSNVCGPQSFATTLATTLESWRLHACRGGGAQGSARLCPRQPAVYNLLGGPPNRRGIPVAREFSHPLSSVRTLRTIPGRGLSHFFVNSPPAHSSKVRTPST